MADSVRRKLKILFAASEAVPFAKSGGLGDVAGSLPRALKHAGAKVAVIMPKYGTIAQEYKDQMKHIADFYVPLSWRRPNSSCSARLHSALPAKSSAS